MNDGSIKIVIGATADRSIEQVFGGLEKRAQKAGQNISKAFNNAIGGTAGQGGAGKAFDATAAAARKAEREIEREIAKRVKAAAAGEKEMQRGHDNAAKAYLKTENEKWREVIKGIKEVEREQAKANRKTEQDAERSAKRIDNARSRFAERTSQRATRFMFPNPIGMLGMAHRIGGDIMRGAGIDFNLGSSVSRTVQAQSMAVQLSNQGFMRNDTGPNGQRVSSVKLEAEARKTAQSTGYSTEQVLASQTKFTDITGNLDDATKAMPAIMRLSGATGTDPEKMAEAWASVSRHMGDIPNKAEKVEGLMRMIAGQGRVGSIEIKDEAKDLGKIAAVADQFHGDKATIIGELTGFAQMAKAEGGASSSSQAATSVVAFKNAMNSGPRIKAMLAAGMKEEDIFHISGTGKNRVRDGLQGPNEIIRKALVITGGDITKFGNIFKSVMAQRATGALVAAYNSGGGHNMAAVNKKINEFGSEATLSSDDVAFAQAERMKTTAAQAVVFQEKLDEVGKEIASDLLPVLKELEPQILEAAHIFGDIVKWAGTNPWKAIMVALTLAIARAAAESSMRAGIEGIMQRGGGSSIAAIGSGTATGAAGYLGTGLKALAAGAAGAGAGGALGYMVGGEGGATTGSIIGGAAGFGAQLGGVPGAVIGASIGLVADQANDLSKVTGGWGGIGAGIGSMLGGNSFFKGVDDYQNEQAREVSESAPSPAKIDTVDLSQNIGTAMAGKTLNVRIINPKDISSGADQPYVGGGGRSHNPSEPKGSSWY